MNRNATFWVVMAVFQVFFGFAVFAITRDHYQARNTTDSNRIEASMQSIDGFSSIDPSLIDALGSDSAFPQTPMEISRKANEQFANGQYARAAESYEKLLTFDASNVDALNNLGLTLHYVGRSEEALQRLNEGVAADPDYQRIWLTLGFVNSALGNAEAAREALNTALSMDPGSDVGLSAAKMLDDLSQ